MGIFCSSSGIFVVVCFEQGKDNTGAALTANLKTEQLWPGCVLFCAVLGILLRITLLNLGTASIYRHPASAAQEKQGSVTPLPRFNPDLGCTPNLVLPVSIECLSQNAREFAYGGLGAQTTQEPGKSSVKVTSLQLHHYNTLTSQQG